MKKIEEDRSYIVKTAKRLGLFNKTFLITGATGMIGSIFVNALRSVTNDENIYALGFDLNDGQKAFNNSKITYFIIRGNNI